MSDITGKENSEDFTLISEMVIGAYVIDKACGYLGKINDIQAGTLYITFANGQRFSYQKHSVMLLTEYLGRAGGV